MLLVKLSPIRICSLMSYVIAPLSGRGHAIQWSGHIKKYIDIILLFTFLKTKIHLIGPISFNQIMKFYLRFEILFILHFFFFEISQS